MILIEGETYGPANTDMVNVGKHYKNCTFSGDFEKIVFHNCHFDTCAFIEGSFVSVDMLDPVLTSCAFKNWRIRKSVFPQGDDYVFLDGQTKKAFNMHWDLKGKGWKAGRKPRSKNEFRVSVDAIETKSDTLDLSELIEDLDKSS